MWFSLAREGGVRFVDQVVKKGFRVVWRVWGVELLQAWRKGGCWEGVRRFALKVVWWLGFGLWRNCVERSPFFDLAI